MTFTPASPLSLFAFVIIVLAVVGAIIAGVHLACRRAGEWPLRPTLVAACVVISWVCLVSAGVATNLVATRPMPGIPIVMAASLLGAMAFAFSPLGRRLSTLPLWMLVAFQAFRLPLELVLHVWASGYTVPETMTWTGSNFDIVSGIVAAIGAILVNAIGPRSSGARGVAWIANGVGFALLINVIRVAARSSPLPGAWPVDPPMQLLMYLPYAWIAPVCVGGALMGHIVLTRALLRKR